MRGIPLSFGSSAATSSVDAPCVAVFEGSAFMIASTASGAISRHRSVAMTRVYFNTTLYDNLENGSPPGCTHIAVAFVLINRSANSRVNIIPAVLDCPYATGGL